jgi:plasmid stabilization system protein ParE
MLTARRTETAERDLREIAFYVAFNDRRPETADRIIDELIIKADNLAQSSKSSQMGTSCPELGDGVRLFSHKRWVIVFRYEAHGIDVLRFADSSQHYLAWRL